jgi:glycoprotein-N-acetylgalactosamine 3-beta-galactosyltransferase
MIITTENVLNTHSLKMYKLWVNECDDHVFVSIIPKKYHTTGNPRPILIEDEFKVLQPPGFESDSYRNLTHKVYLSFKHLYKTEKDPFDWYLKADVDTFVFIDNLREFVKDKNALHPVTYGYNYKTVVPKGYQSGGAGYLISREAFVRLGSALNKNYSFCPNSGFEDIDVARCLRKLQVNPASSLDQLGRERFHPLDFDHHYNGKFNGRYKWLNSYAANPLKKVSKYLQFLMKILIIFLIYESKKGF